MCTYLYVQLQFFPKNEKYVSLFTGAEDSEVVEKRSRMRKQIKANIIVAAASGKELDGKHDLLICNY